MTKSDQCQRARLTKGGFETAYARGLDQMGHLAELVIRFPAEHFDHGWPKCAWVLDS
jgi:hypothetical protein